MEANSGAALLKLHPLIIINISDHHTRKLAQTGKACEGIFPLVKAHVVVVGALFGTQSGREIELMNSFELLCDEVDGIIKVNEDYFTTKLEQCK